MTTDDPLAEPGMYDGVRMPWIPDHVYHANARVSRSQLRIIRTCPFKLRHALDHPGSVVPTPDMIQGSALHAGILEPERFLDDYALEPQVDGSSSFGRGVLRDFRKEHAEKTIVPKAKAMNLLGMIMRVRQHPRIQPVLQGGGLVEVTAAWDDSESGLRQRARLDLLNDTDDGPTVLDVKKVQDASEEGFERQMINDQLYLQAGMYLEGATEASGIPHKRFGFIAFEEARPHACGIHWMSEEYLRVGRSLYYALRDRFRRCAESGVWPDYAEQGINVMYPPAFMTR
jgi:hypothetical protein